MLININFPGQLQWRSHEYAGAKDAFGEVIDGATMSNPRVAKADAFRWFPPSEEIGTIGYVWMQEQRSLAPNGKYHINDARHYLGMHDKLIAFETWHNAGLPIPQHFQFATADEFHSRWDGTPNYYPILLRLNNSVAGYDSWLVRSRAELQPALDALVACHGRHVAAGRGINTRMMCVEFIDTRRPDCPLNVSYRISVAGGKVVTGYARVSDPQDWVAVTNKFHAGIADAWLAANRRCHQIMLHQANLLVKAVAATGMNHQGLDLIEDGRTGKLYFLETQTTYDAGFINAGPYQPPYYNPYNRELVKFIQENSALLQKEIPLYYNAWLDKREHFRQCYANLAAQMKEGAR